MGNHVPVAHAEQDIDIGEASGCLVERIRQISAMHDHIGSAKTLLHGLTERQRDQGPGFSIWVDVDARRLEAAFGYGRFQAELVENPAGVWADLQPRAKLGDNGIALEYHNSGAKFGQGQGQRQTANAGASNVIGPACARHLRADLGGVGLIDSRKRVRGAFVQTRIEHVVGRAIWADDLAVLAHIEIDMRMVKRGQGANALEFLGPDLDLTKTFGIVEVRRCAVCHRKEPGAMI